MSGEPFIHPLSQIHATSSRRIVADANFSRKLLHFGLTRHTAYAARSYKMREFTSQAVTFADVFKTVVKNG